MSSAVAMETKKKEEDVKGGELLFCGTTRSEAEIKRKVLPLNSFVSPTRLRSLVGVDIRYVASGCASNHCVALDVDGRCFTWGKNEASS
ncbi:protein RCC2 [Tanacetum coccineum]